VSPAFFVMAKSKATERKWWIEKLWIPLLLLALGGLGVVGYDMFFKTTAEPLRGQTSVQQATGSPNATQIGIQQGSNSSSSISGSFNNTSVTQVTSGNFNGATFNAPVSIDKSFNTTTTHEYTDSTNIIRAINIELQIDCVLKAGESRPDGEVPFQILGKSDMYLNGSSKGEDGEFSLNLMSPWRFQNLPNGDVRMILKFALPQDSKLIGQQVSLLNSVTNIQIPFDVPMWRQFQKANRVFVTINLNNRESGSLEHRFIWEPLAKNPTVGFDFVKLNTTLLRLIRNSTK
jgi:hypothetical protein